MRKHAGQALVEFAGSATLLTLVLLGAGRVLFAEWEKTRCSILVFEKTHARRTGSRDPYPDFRLRTIRVSIRESLQGFRGEAWCGSAHETVDLPKLETAAEIHSGGIFQ